MKRIRILLLLLFAIHFGASAQDTKVDSLPKFSVSTVPEFGYQLEDIFSDPNFNSAIWGVMIQSASNGEYFFKKNEEKLLIPASNLKLITTAAGLCLLGKDYSYRTELFANGEQDGTTLKGDLIVKGYGDPTISGRLYNDDITRVFQIWADSLLERGIDEIDGNIVGDDNAFDDVGLGEGWEWDYESSWFAAPSGALTLNDNCVDIIVKPGIVGEKAKLEYLPLTKYINIINNVITVPSDSVTGLNVYRERKTNIITVSGTIKTGAEFEKLYATINNPTQYFVNVLRDVLIQKGITVKGFGVDIDDLSDQIDYQKCRHLITFHSAPLPVILNIINKNSQNLFAELLLKTIGFEKEKLGSAANGIKWVKKFLQNVGINTENISVVDGSGLSHLNLVTPKQIVTLLNYMSKHELFKFYFNSLSVAGKDGSLSGRMQKTRAENNVHGKTGFISAARSLSGYIYTGDHELVAFSMIVNNFTVPVKLADNLQDLVCLRLANFKRK